MATSLVRPFFFYFACPRREPSRLLARSVPQRFSIPPPTRPRPPPALRLVFDCVVAGLLTFLSTLLALALRRPLRRPAPASAAAFFHPYTSDGGGGERVLWCAVRAVQELCPGLPCAVFTGDASASPPAQLAGSVSVFYAHRSSHIETNKSSLDLFGTNQTQQPSFMSDLDVQLPSAFGQMHHGWGRINSFTKEAVAKVVDDTYRKMQIQFTPDLATRSHSGSDLNHFMPKEEANVSFQAETKVRCLCGSTILDDNMIKDDRCQVWQHMSCVLILDKPTEGVSPEVPPHFYCGLCRLSRADLSTEFQQKAGK